MVPRPKIAPGPPTTTRASAAVPPPPPPPTGPAFITYNELPASVPPQDTSALLGSHLPAPNAAPEPEVHAAPPPVPPPVAETPAAPPPQPEKPPPPPKPPKPPREPLSPGLIVAGLITALLLIGSGVAALLLSGGDEPRPAAALEPERTARPEPTRAVPKRSDADLRRQVMTLDDLMKQSQDGRAAAASGDTQAAIANRSNLLKKLRRLRGQTKDATLKAGLGSFVAAIRESLRQNRECADACPASDLDKVNSLKRETVEALNPLLRKYAKTTYRGRDI